MRIVPIRMLPNYHTQGRRCPTVLGRGVGRGHKLEAPQKEPGPGLISPGGPWSYFIKAVSPVVAVLYLSVQGF